MTHLIAIDQGTTSTRAIVFDARLARVASASEELRQIYPAPGEVEHDPEEIWAAVVKVVRAAMEKANVTAKDVAGIGIANQRETTIVWERATGKPIHNAIVWQDRRTAELCARLKADGHEAAIAAKTGLLCDPYFSGTKIAWLLDNVEGARAAARARRLAFGTVDTFLLWRLTGGKVHATDVTNASRTLLFDIRRGSGPRSWKIGCMFRKSCCLASVRTRRITASRARSCSADRSGFSAWPATSRPQPSGRAAFFRE